MMPQSQTFAQHQTISRKVQSWKTTSTEVDHLFGAFDKITNSFLKFLKKESTYLLNLPLVRSCLRLLAALGLVRSASKYSKRKRRKSSRLLHLLGAHRLAFWCFRIPTGLLKVQKVMESLADWKLTMKAWEGKYGKCPGFAVGSVGCACARICQACCWFVIWSLCQLFVEEQQVTNSTLSHQTAGASSRCPFKKHFMHLFAVYAGSF